MKKLLLIIALLIAIPSLCFAADLGQAVTNTSLKSEIHRGFLTINKYVDSSSAELGFQVDYQIPKAIDQNVLNGRDSEGFDCGVYFFAWLKTNHTIDKRVPIYVLYPSSYDTPEKLEQAKKEEIALQKENEKYAIKFYKRFREAQSEWGISDEKICEINNIDYDIVKPWFDKYWSLTHQEN